MSELKRSAAVLFTTFLINMLVPGYAWGQEVVDLDPEMPGIQQKVAPVKLDGNTLFKVRGISTYPAEQRAISISKKIKEVANDRSISPDSLKAVPSGARTTITAGGKFIMNVYDIDAEIEDATQQIVSIIIIGKTAEAIKAYRDSRTRPNVIKSIIHASVALVLTVLFIVLLAWIFRIIDRRLRSRLKSRIDNVEVASFKLIKSNQLWTTYQVAFNIIRVIIFIILIFGSIEYILGILPWTRNIADYVLGLVLDPLISIGKGIFDFIPDLFFLFILILLTRYFLKLARLLFTGIHQRSIKIKNFEPEWAIPTFRLVRLLVIVLAAIVAFPYIPGSNTVAFKGISVFIGVLVSLGSTSLISNLIAGFTMTYRRAFIKNDLIQVGNHMGFVEEQEVLATRIRTLKNEEVIIPNSVLLNSDIKNFGSKASENRIILYTKVGIGYDTSWRMVDAMLKLAAERTEGLLKDPPPYVLQKALGDHAITYELNVYCDDPSVMMLYYSKLHQNILDVFNENNIQIMTPSYVLDPEEPKVVPTDKWNTPLRKDK